MSDSKHNDHDLSDLFKQESATNIQYLTDNLLLLEENPSDKTQIASIMRAAHSLKGAARIIGFNTFSHLAHLLEDCFVAIQKNDLSLTHEDFDSLLHAIDFLTEIAQLSDDEINSWNPQQLEKLESIKDSILQITQGPSQSIETKDTSTAIERKTVHLETIRTKPSSAVFIVFKNETLAQVAVIKTELESLRHKPHAAQDFSNLLTSILSIKGASNIANEKKAESIAQSLEKIVNDLKSQNNELTEELIEKILDLSNQLLEIASVEVEPEIAEAEVSPTPSAQTPKSLIINKTMPSIDKSLIEEKKTPPPRTKPIEQKTATPESPDQFVRVSAANLNRLMSLAAETLIETRRLEPIKQGLLQLKNLQRQLANLLNFSLLNPSDLNLNIIDQQASHSLNQFRNLIQNQLEIFDTFSKNNSVLSSRLYNEVLTSRMRPFSEGVQGFPRLVRDLAKSLNKKISLEITGKDTPVDRDILEKLEAPLNHIIRNACDHGIEEPQKRLEARKSERGLITMDAHHNSGMLMITISDDGAGINKNQVKEIILAKNLLPKNIVDTLNDEELFDFLFLPGFSTTKNITEISGRGVGLDVVRNFVQEIGGKIRVQSTEGKGTKFTLQLPITRSVIRALSVEIDQEPYAIPLSRIDRILKIKNAEIHTLEDRDYFHLDGENIAMFSLRQILGFVSNNFRTSEFIPVIILREKDKIYSLVIDKILTETELVVRPLDPRLRKIPCIAASSITDDGTPVLILDVEDILKFIQKLLSGKTDIESFSKKQLSHKPSKSVLVIDDSLTVRETERRILQNAGYNVETAVDGVDGWNCMKNKKFNLVITDIDMPRMNGFELVNQIKKDSHLKKTPIIIVSYKDRKVDHLKGSEVGADYYLTKSSFKDQTFLNTVKSLIGEPSE